jgi:hypothetical protein
VQSTIVRHPNWREDIGQARFPTARGAAGALMKAVADSPTLRMSVNGASCRRMRDYTYAISDVYVKHFEQEEFGYAT